MDAGHAVGFGSGFRVAGFLHDEQRAAVDEAARVARLLARLRPRQTRREV